MSEYIEANVSRMFESVEPWDCSNNAFNLGQNVGQLTWRAALSVADNAESWLLSDRDRTVEGTREWARESGGWSREEIAAWTDRECLALFVQNIAGELRDNLNADEVELAECARIYDATDWDKESSYPRGVYWLTETDNVHVQFYTGI